MRKEDKHRLLGELGFTPGEEGFGKIEEQRDKWAEKRRLTYPDQKAEIAVIRKSRVSFLEYPLLGLEDHPEVPSWVPRVHPVTGSVYTTRWQNVEINEKNANDFIVLGGTRYGPDVDLGKMPKSWKSVMLVPQKVEGGIEPAMRQQDEIRSDYSLGSVESSRVFEIFRTANLLSTAFINGMINSDKDLEKLSKETEKTLVRQGITNSSGNSWKTIMDYMLRAKEKDLLGRRNPQRSRILARAAYLRAVEKEVEVGLVNSKANRVFTYLDVVRNVTRINLENAMVSLDWVAGVGKKKGIHIFSEMPADVSPRDMVMVSEILRGIIDSHLKPVQAAPYLGVARAAEAILMGSFFKFTKKEIEELKVSLEEGGFPQSLVNKPVEEYLRQKDINGAQRRMRQAYSLIRASLEDPDHEETTVFD